MSNRKIKRVFLRQLDAINERSKMAVKNFGENKIPLAMFRTVLDTAKLQVTNEPTLKPVVDQFNVTVEKMFEVAKDSAKQFENKSIKLTFVKEMVEVMKKAFTEGFNG